MSGVADEPRLFRVRARHEDPHHGRLVSESSFEAAAVAYAEGLVAQNEAVLGLVVREVATGHEHRFTIHLDHGQAVAEG